MRATSTGAIRTIARFVFMWHGSVLIDQAGGRAQIPRNRVFMVLADPRIMLDVTRCIQCAIRLAFRLGAG